MGELSPLRKQQTEQKQKSEPQNSLQENLVPRFSLLPVSTERRVKRRVGERTLGTKLASGIARKTPEATGRAAKIA